MLTVRIIGSPVGFPSGGNTTAIKVEEARQLIRDGVDEMDMMLNVGKLRSGEEEYVLEEMKQVIGAAGNTPVKVILECHYLSDEQIRRGCELCLEAGAAFVKTSTGWAPTGATLENVALIKSCVGDAIGIKAAGGIRGLETLIEMYRRGARRFGIGLSTATRIFEECAPHTVTD